MADLFGAIDLTTVTGSVGTVGVAIVGIALAIKGISLVKRVLSPL